MLAALECPICHSYTEDALMPNKHLKVCLQCCHVVAIDDIKQPPVACTLEDEQRLRTGKSCPDCSE